MQKKFNFILVTNVIFNFISFTKYTIRRSILIFPKKFSVKTTRQLINCPSYKLLDLKHISNVLLLNLLVYEINSLLGYQYNISRYFSNLKYILPYSVRFFKKIFFICYDMFRIEFPPIWNNWTGKLPTWLILFNKNCMDQQFRTFSKSGVMKTGY